MLTGGDETCRVADHFLKERFMTKKKQLLPDVIDAKDYKKIKKMTRDEVLVLALRRGNPYLIIAWLEGKV